MGLIRDIPENSMRRMKAMAEANQMMEERIQAEAKRMEMKQNKIQNNKKDFNNDTTNKLEKPESEIYVDKFDLSTSSLTDLLKKTASVSSAISFAEFVDETFSFLSPKSLASKSLIARENYLHASAKISERAYDHAVNKVKKMPPLLADVIKGDEINTVDGTFVNPNEVVVDKRTEVEKEMDEIEEFMPGSKEEMWWHSMLYSGALAATPTSTTNKSLLNQSGGHLSPKKMGVINRQNSSREWKL